MTHKQRFVFLVAVPLALLTLIALTTPKTTLQHGYDSDGRRYAAMAGAPDVDPDLGRAAPFLWRVLSPFVASTLPGPYLFRFRTMAFLSNWATLALLFSLLHTLVGSVTLAAIGVALYGGVFWTLKFSWYSPFYVDYQTQMFLVLITLLAVRERFLVIPFVVALAVLQKESLLLGGAFSIACFARKHPGAASKTLAYGVAVVAPAAAVLVLLRMLERPTSQHWTILQAFAILSAKSSVGQRLALSFVSGLGILGVFALCYVRSLWTFFKERWEWGLYALLSCLALLGGVDKARLFLYLLVPLTVATTFVLRTRLSAPPNRWQVAWVGLTLLCHLWLGHYLSPMGSSDDYLNRMVPEWAPRWPPSNYIRQVAVVLAAWLFATLLFERQRGSVRAS